MTSEVAILTKTAVVVAADSAVTVGETKVHRSTTKIFQITNDIGAMVYGYSELGGMPWEVILKLFRKEHGHESFSTVERCYDSIRVFLDEKRFKIEDGIVEGLARFSIEVVEAAKSYVEDIPKKSRNISSISQIIEKEIKEYNDIDEFMDFDAPSPQQFKKEIKGIIGPVVEQVFSDIGYTVPSRLLPKFIDLLYSALKSGYISDYASGLVVFGFGSDELFPSIHEVLFDTMPFGRIRSMVRNTNNAQKGGVGINPLAEREIMDTIIQGTSMHLKEVFIEGASVIANEVAGRIIDDNLQAVDHAVAKTLANNLIRDVIRDYGETISRYIGETYAWGMVETIENMPKEDLAVLAEALVEITALRIHTSTEIESVGGPVDVCVITKGDGLIWTKRKHYFDLNKNLQYLHRRYGVLMPPLERGE